MRGKEFIEYDNPFDVGMTGLLGFSSGYHAMMDCDLLLMLGTDFPYQQFYPQGRDDRPDRYSRGTNRPPHQSRPWLCGRHEIDARALLPQLNQNDEQRT